MAILRDILFGTQNAPTHASGGGGRASPDKLAIGRQIFDYFVSKGLAPHQAAAIAGNMAWEGGGRTDLVNPGDNWKNSPRSPHSVGIGQWNDRAPALIDFARSQGVDIPQGDLRDSRYMQDVIRRIPLNTQLDFAYQEMQGSENRAFRNIQSGGDLRSAAAGAISYHRPAGWSWGNPTGGHGFAGRLSLADQVLRAAGSSPQPPDGMDAASYSPRTAPSSAPTLASPSTAPSTMAAAPSSTSGGLLGGILPEGVSKLLDSGDKANSTWAAKMAEGSPEPAGGIIAPPAPQVDLTALRALMQRKGLLGTMGA
jgi:hypothetical protein